MTFNSLTKHVKDVPFFQGAQSEFPKFKRDMITSARNHGLFRVIADYIEIYVAQIE